MGELARQKTRLVESYERSMREEQRRVEGREMMQFATAAAVSAREIDEIQSDEEAIQSVEENEGLGEDEDSCRDE